VKIYLLFSNSHYPLSPVIRAVTTIQERRLAKYSHVALVLSADPSNGDAVIIESTLSGKGVKLSTVSAFKKRAKNWELVELKEQVTQDQFDMMQIVACRELNKPYDLKGIIGLGIGRNWEQPSDWWCSELVAYILKKIGMKLNGWKPTYIYTPTMCYDWSKRVIDKSVF
jgi:Permuted papain-like amidase enzyme, YaeF/YiiX, C92 family